MRIVPTTDWRPDAAAFGNPGALRAENVLPAATGYKPMRSLVPFTNALDAYPRGALASLDDALVTRFYAGDAAKLYSLTGSTWADASKAGGYSTGTEERWEFARWKNRVIATNYSDSPQVIDKGGTNFADLTTDFRARHIAVVRDFVVMGNTWDSVKGERIDRVRWCGLGDETSWSVSSITGADVRDLNTGGRIQRIFGGEYGLVLSQKAVFRLTYTGAPTWFRLDEVLPGMGAIAPGAAAQHGDRLFFLSENGFMQVLRGQESLPIGSGRVDQHVLNDLDSNYIHRISSTVDPQGNRVFWAYPGAGNVGGRPNKLVIYDYALDRWSSAALEVELIWSATGVSATLEDLDNYSTDIDALGTSLDSSAFKGRAPRLGGFDAQFKHGFFSGAGMTAVVETSEVEPLPSRRSTVTAFRALADGGSVSARVGVRSSQSDVPVYVAAGTPRAGGRIPVRASGRFHRFELTLSGEWSDVVGVHLDPSDTRPSGRRG